MITIQNEHTHKESKTLLPSLTISIFNFDTANPVVTIFLTDPVQLTRNLCSPHFPPKNFTYFSTNYFFPSSFSSSLSNLQLIFYATGCLSSLLTSPHITTHPHHWFYSTLIHSSTHLSICLPH